MLFLGLGVLAIVGCADPCFDDGLAQGGCPEQASEPTEGTESESADATRGDATSPDGTVDDTGVGTGNGTGIECPQLEEVLLPQIPTFQLVVDQSGSMDQNFGGNTRWEAIESTLVGPDGVVTELQSSIRFGLSLYRHEMGTCPQVESLAPSLDAANEIADFFATQQPGGETPTGESLEQITAELLGDDWDGDKVIVLATDGEPDTCAIPNPTNQAQTDEVRGVAVDAVTAAYDAGIRTFVISVGPDIAEAHLQDLANAGVGEPGGSAQFYVANDTASLLAAFNSIVAGLRPCDFELASPLPPALAGSCSLTINDDSFPFDDADGWSVSNETTLELQGSACEAIQEGIVSIQLQCSCE